MKKFLQQSIWLLIAFLWLGQTAWAQTSALSVEKIMKDPKWMGSFPSNPYWSEDGSKLYFTWNKDNADPADSLYVMEANKPETIRKVTIAERKAFLPRGGTFNTKKTLKLYTQNGMLKLQDMKKNTHQTILDLGGNISNAAFMLDESKISFNFNNNVYILDRSNSALTQITNFASPGNGGDRSSNRNGSGSSSDQDDWLQEDNTALIQVLQDRNAKREASRAYNNMMRSEPTGRKSISAGTGFFNGIQVSPDGNFVTYNIYKPATGGKRTIVPDYLDESGYTTDINARTKVGNPLATMTMHVYDVRNDKSYEVSTADIPGIADLPDYVKDYPEKTWEKKNREVYFSSPYYSDNGQYAIVNIRSQDNKDRWIMQIDLSNGKLIPLDRQRDEAWIAGPGMGYSQGGGTLGWLPDNKHIYFQSEATGYSHLYLLDITTGQKKQLTDGEFEVFDPFISQDKKSWYFTSSQVHPGERHFYKMPLYGGKAEQITSLTGNNEVSLSPDEKNIALIYSFSNKPQELFLMPNKAGAQAQQVTNSQSEEFKAYNWRAPEVTTFKAADGQNVYARLYEPSADKKNGAAVIFVHGAGYLQNAHKWWSTYFREYMFHNLLTDLGYTVLDIDYRGSAGYGRDVRTGIYRHMGGKDLSDHVDGAKWLVNEKGVDAGRIGIYGGSYGGFITLMAMFNESETFAAGAALRSVTDWAHYNHGYTSNILNTPVEDPIAYRRSSPIYFAEGLKGDLLIAHGMVDTNVHFQDVVRLAQRLIELEKDNWEMAVYPMEDHGFVEPSSWTDEYKRILKLFNNTLLNK
ncbi:S9 family peptidase [Penaeicola halotolerans]|uniref:S9 family peptidase n=1 Tax=Penaeicola halotolerans TaxID=2793196 RepID=UPI001CF8CC53|nr:prolyl oligopeptidase family serine peptidase [Penaeicola halotolerans]